MSLLPATATYAEEVTDYYLQFARGGVQLSGLDADILLSWEDQGVPREVVCRGIRAAAEQRRFNARPSEAALRSLRACERFVLKEWKLYRDLSTGKGDRP